MTHTLDQVRKAMGWMEINIVRRPMPDIVRVPGLSYYCPTTHTIGLSLDTLKKLAHELCHSQQPDTGKPAYRRPDGSIDGQLWMSDPGEREAMAVATVVVAMQDSDWPRVQGIAEASGVSGIDRAAMVAWVKKPHQYHLRPHMGRAARMRINRLMEVKR